MGVFDTYEIDCPHCGQTIEDEKKPGSMKYYRFGDNPIIDMRFSGFYSCYHCHKEFTVEMEFIPKMIVKKDYK